MNAMESTLGIINLVYSKSKVIFFVFKRLLHNCDEPPQSGKNLPATRRSSLPLSLYLKPLKFAVKFLPLGQLEPKNCRNGDSRRGNIRHFSISNCECRRVCKI